MKKFIYILLIVIITSLGACGIGGLFAYADISETECDKVFIETLAELMPNDEAVTVTAQKDLLYDITLEPLGYIYFFDTEQGGYAIVINAFGYYECTEIYFQAENPYKDYDGKKVYIKIFTYWIFDDEVFVNVDTDMDIPTEFVDMMYQKAYFANSNFIFTEEQITFISRVENKYELATRVPQFYGNGTANGCVPIAGGNIIIYYTRFSPNLMSGFTPGSYLGTNYLYKVLAPEIDQMVNILKADMGTTSEGTTIPQFKTGMTKYCSTRGYTIAYNSCMNGNSFNYTLAKQRIDEGQPLVVFTDPFTVTAFAVSGSTDTVSTMYCNAPHAMASFGYREITYTLTTGTRKDTYIQVSSGIDLRSTGYCRINNTTVFDDVYAIKIN